MDIVDEVPVDVCHERAIFLVLVDEFRVPEVLDQRFLTLDPRVGDLTYLVASETLPTLAGKLLP